MPLTQDERRARHAARQRERRARMTPEQLAEHRARHAARQRERYVPKPRVEPARDPANPCPWCSAPMRPRQRKHCGESECRRRYTNERNRRWQREYAERHGVSYQHAHYPEQRAAHARANPYRALYPERAQAQDARRRARKAGAESETFRHREVFERDGWVCGICSDPVDPALAYPDPRSASLDHVVPLSLDGPHTRANSRCAHLECNIRRGARMENDQAVQVTA